MTQSPRGASLRTRRFLAVRAGTYPAAMPPLGEAAGSEDAARSSGEDSHSLTADLPDFGLSDAFQATSAPAPPVPVRAPAREMDVVEAPGWSRPGPVSEPTPGRRTAEAPSRGWARNAPRRILIGAALGGALGIVVGSFMLWVFRGSAPLMALSDPVLLWSGADQYRKLAAVLVTVGFAVLGAARAIRTAGDVDPHIN